MTTQLLTLAEAARALRISIRGVQRLVEQCKLPRTQLGRRVMFRAKDIERLIDKHTR